MNNSWADTLLASNDSPIEAEAYSRGFRKALEEFGIWKDGVQTIGCMPRPIKEISQEIIKAAHDRIHWLQHRTESN